ncbi:MAG: class I SAM-dependent methyltransferase [Gammaproteobacteria bacterium]|nr:class I SAM-dependent methyltransferase [Gammaproteobacteria bacterium]
MSLPQVFLRAGRDASLRRRHPWVFTGAVAELRGRAAPGDTVAVHCAKGELLGLGAWSPASQIRVRMWSFEAGEHIDEDFFLRRVMHAVSQRLADPWLQDTNARRLVNGESDGLPGVIADQYDNVVVMQLLSAGAERWRDALIAALRASVACEVFLERSDSDVRAKEGLAPRVVMVAGELPAPLLIREGPVRYEVDCQEGHKTGFYLDQRDNRALMDQLAGEARVLNCFAYTGGFGVRALAAGAQSVVQLDASAPALACAQRQLEHNALAAQRVEHVCANAFGWLREARQQRRRFDVVILDPPKFVAGAAQLRRGTRGYKDINLQALDLIAPGGWLLTFSCSGQVEPRLFQKIVADAALDAGRELSIVRWLHQSGDHPVTAAFPEGLYLKGLLCRVN